jgi:SAM-dependent methyltransferase
VDAVERLSRKVAAEKTVLASEHRHRYELAARLCAGRRVADVCCGTGYGCEILNQAGATVTGIDSDASAIEAAQAEIGPVEGIELELRDAQDFLAGDLQDRFDAIVMLEGLEHLSDPEAAITELKRHARSGLKLILSIPNDRIVEEDNPHHLTSYGYEEMQAAFEGFDDLVLLYQYLAEGSLIGPGEGRELAGGIDLLERGEPEYANHFIACVGFADSPALADWTAQMHLNVAPLYNSHIARLAEANRQLWRTNAQLANERIGKAGAAAAASELHRQSAELELATLKGTLSWRILGVLRGFGAILRRPRRWLRGRA